MSERHFTRSYGGSAPENYERFFVPALGRPFATDLLEVAALGPGERVLDVGCGTGIVARMAVERVGPGGRVAGLDVNPGMLGVAAAVAPPGSAIEWHEASAESMPLPDEAFDVVLCQMSLQFVPDRAAALREMRRVLVPGGRALLNFPGPAGKPLEALADALGRHIAPQAAGFVRQVFSLYDAAELEGLLAEAGFREIGVRADTRKLSLPAPGDFLWQYVHATPLSGVVADADDEARAALEGEVLAAWREFEVEDGMECEQRIVTARALR